MNILGRKAAVCLTTYSYSLICHSKLLAGVIFIKSFGLYTTLSPALAVTKSSPLSHFELSFKSTGSIFLNSSRLKS